LITFSAQATDSPSTGSATFVSATDVKAALAKADPTKTSDNIVRMIDERSANVGVAVVHRPKAPKGQAGNALQHSKVIEVYYVLEGRAVMVTGGKLLNATPLALAAEQADSFGPSLQGAADPAGSQSRTIGPGDIVFVPAGMTHYFSEIPDNLTYLVYRIDPVKVAPLH
jgi:mannose-6-phosphate isomerase-like protein (cupin superfamily)